MCGEVFEINLFSFLIFLGYLEEQKACLVYGMQFTWEKDSSELLILFIRILLRLLIWTLSSCILFYCRHVFAKMVYCFVTLQNSSLLSIDRTNELWMAKFIGKNSIFYQSSLKFVPNSWDLWPYFFHLLFRRHLSVYSASLWFQQETLIGWIKNLLP